MVRTTLLAALMLGTALSAHAQQQAPSMSPSTEKETVAPAPAPANRADEALPTTRTAPLAAGSWSVKDRLNAAVYNPAGDRVGDVNDIVVDENNKISQLVIGVGGFLGIGEKEVAVSPTEVKSAVQKDGKIHFIMDATKQSLQAAPTFIRPRG